MAYCDESLGKILYEDKLKTIDNIDLLGDFLAIVKDNKELSKDLYSRIKILKNKKIVSNYYEINKFNFFNDYIKTMNNLYIKTKDFSFLDGISDVGYIYIKEKIEYTLDLQPIYNLNLITKDIISPIISKNNKMYKMLDSEQIDFFNKINLSDKKNILLIGNDLGYLINMLKNENKNIYIYNIDESLFNFLIKHIYSKINTQCNITYVSDLDTLDLNLFDSIILNDLFEYSYYFFINNKLYNYLDKLSIINYDKIMLKIKEDFRDLIYTEKNEFRRILFEEVKVMKNYNAQLKIAQIDFIEIADKYLKENNIYFNNYKNFNKFIKYDYNLIDILKTK